MAYCLNDRDIRLDYLWFFETKWRAAALTDFIADTLIFALSSAAYDLLPPQTRLLAQAQTVLRQQELCSESLQKSA